MMATMGTASFLIASRRISLNSDSIILFVSIWLTFYSISGMNDWCDENLDTLAGRQEKPLVAGDLSRTSAQYLWIMTGLAALVASFHFGFATVCVGAIAWSAAAAYNLGAKSTVLSWVPYAIFIPSFPVWGFAAAEKVTPGLLLVYPLGVLLALGLNIANTLPDLERDKQGGVVGITHRLGRAQALALLWCCFGATVVLDTAIGIAIGNNLFVLAPSLIAATILLCAMIADWLVCRSPQSLRRSWYSSVIFAAIVGCAWIASLP
jgi:4-hydroxybenzoate polyprenyltransferase